MGIVEDNLFLNKCILNGVREYIPTIEGIYIGSSKVFYIKSSLDGFNMYDAVGRVISDDIEDIIKTISDRLKKRERSNYASLSFLKEETIGERAFWFSITQLKNRLCYEQENSKYDSCVSTMSLLRFIVGLDKDMNINGEEVYGAMKSFEVYKKVQGISKERLSILINLETNGEGNIE